ncbi:TTF-type domain-containing protein [Trichonephila clavipes]|nr:TTF-type domain-containing protein [Trichonephila clavipes]
MANIREGNKARKNIRPRKRRANFLHLKNIGTILFQRLIDIINFLANHNLVFRGHRESFKTDEDTKNSGNFIDLFKLISKYDPKLRKHINPSDNKQLVHHYVSHDIQSELITIMSNIVTREVIGRIKEAKYSFLINCTRDCGRIEQMLIILRYCNTSTGSTEENFIGFFGVTETTREYLTNMWRLGLVARCDEQDNSW